MATVTFKDEAAFQKKLVQCLNALGWAVQVHNDVGHPGVPDLSFAVGGVDGWLELKWMDEKPGTINDIRHFTSEQKNWLHKTGSVGSGNCCLVLGTPGQFFVIPWSVVLNNKYKIKHELASSVEELAIRMERLFVVGRGR